MKNAFLTITLAIAAHLAFAQTHFSAYSETTGKGLKTGIMTGHVFELVYPGYATYDFAVGGFFQHEIPNAIANENAIASVREKVLYGAYAELMFNSSNRFSMAFNLRTGIQNGEGFVIAPMIKTRYEFLPKAHVELGISSRNVVSPTLSYGISFQF